MQDLQGPVQNVNAGPLAQTLRVSRQRQPSIKSREGPSECRRLCDRVTGRSQAREASRICECVLNPFSRPPGQALRSCRCLSKERCALCFIFGASAACSQSALGFFCFTAFVGKGDKHFPPPAATVASPETTAGGGAASSAPHPLTHPAPLPGINAEPCPLTPPRRGTCSTSKLEGMNPPGPASSFHSYADGGPERERDPPVMPRESRAEPGPLPPRVCSPAGGLWRGLGERQGLEGRKGD